ncbi:hypothetical protein COT97_05140 [Candidatus Falkowbacteria bacterium CG10_big_fil_rev_8_21_14_0_10_39_11]|uniref:Uncharacterized protein n=1 Tax=Candidatus Falkowbacteria bacterium CG10_big_fil_rev_8_21_14_0_10_39_11 TaxID=1974565 RepID=A0A2H0V3S2_9BACT|nr:MAG: hypothetical protein COT97_05140 [Candidatus Falkowbacteria bacterium CG10_big_fil_rev_8_21_14_0_10_39_11]
MDERRGCSMIWLVIHRVILIIAAICLLGCFPVPIVTGVLWLFPVFVVGFVVCACLIDLIERKFHVPPPPEQPHGKIDPLIDDNMMHW